MTTRDENYLSMCRTVNSVFTKYAEVWQAHKRFAREVETFGTLLNQLHDVKVDAEVVTTGATVDKADAAMQLYAKAVDLGKRASVYALDNNNQELHNQLRTSRGALSNMHDTFSLAKARDIYKRVEEIKDELGDYGVSAEDLAELKQLIDAYDMLIDRPRELIVERKGHNESIPELLKSLRESVYKMDSLINLFSGTAFETDYRNARIIVDMGRRKKQKEEETPPLSE